MEEMASVANRKKITKELLEKKYQISNIKYQALQILSFLAKKDKKEGLKLTSKIVEQGIDMKYFLEQLINTLHEELLTQLGVASSKSKVGFSVEEVKHLIELLARAHSELKYAVLPQLPLELAIIGWGLQAQNSAEPYAEQRKVEVQHNSASSSASFSDSQIAKSKNLDLWQRLIEKARSYNHSVAGVLRGCVLKSYDGKKLVIETGYKFHKERLEDNKIKKVLEQALEEITGETAKVLVMLK
ncbi:hypothetical protein HYU45_05155 [Candidatus Daviesbacteria bacterium]|nr:hypothetical protein [Candidatus Daviesbacteria bacterium]